jgi:hypothetical protein
MRVQEPILLLGSGRSGTTWLLDSLAEANGLRTIFEPLHPTAVPGAVSHANAFQRPGEENEHLRNHLQKYLYERCASIWCDCRFISESLHPQWKYLWSPKDGYFFLVLYMRLFSRAFKSFSLRNNRRIIKFIRANLLLGWMREQFPEAKIIYLLRHPCAVIASKMKRRDKYWNFNDEMQQGILHRYLSDEQLKIEYRRKMGIVVPVPSCEVSGHAFMWCVENVLPLAQARENEGVMTLFYEDLVASPDRELARIKNHLLLDHVPNAVDLSKPSLESSKEIRKKVVTSVDLHRWQGHFDRAQLHQIGSMLRMFHIDCYHVEHPLPIQRNRWSTEAGRV